ncbi:MAG: MlaD family protein [Candidatus Rhabdochlamydia sp.]
MTQQTKNFLIGLFFTTAIGFFVTLVLFLKPSIGDEKQTIFVRFSDINKVNVGTRVLFAGKAIGEVTAIHEIYHARETQPTDELGRLFFYQLTLKIDSKVHVYSTDEISIQTSGLLGEKSISITPKAPIKGETPERITDKIPFYADSVDPIENTFNSMSELGEKLNVTVSQVNAWLSHNQDELSLAVSSFTKATNQINALILSMNEEKLIPKFQEITTSSIQVMNKLDHALAIMNDNQVSEKIVHLVKNLDDTSNSLKDIFQNIASPQGTLGKLISSDDMYLRVTALLSKVDTLMNDVNHYGLLFHLNKGWQRSRLKRAHQLEALKSPASFKTYFEEEVDSINLSMTRLSKLIDKAQGNPQAEMLSNPQFQEDFALLLRQIDTMSSQLNLYNEQYNERVKP